jgi:excisionase family DNA binding protein
MYTVLTIDQAASETGMSKRTIYNWIKTGRVRYVKSAGGKIMVLADSLWRTQNGDAWTDPDTPIVRNLNTTKTLNFPGRTLL